MTSTCHWDVDIDKLFEQHTIKEIEEIQKKIQLESDRKKIELRTLVGERYRDLILAADTIGKMRLTAERISSRIADTENKFRELQERYLIGFKTEPVNDGLERRVNQISPSVIIKIKILMDIPEIIWSCIEKKDLLHATQFFIVAQYIKYRLKFEVGEQQLIEKYPIVLKHWDIIGQFKHVIFRESDKILQSLTVSSEITANCLASLVLLNKTPCTELLDKLIHTRSRAIEAIVKDENDYSVKTKIKLCVEMSIHTVTLIHACFINAENEQEGLVSQYIKSVRNEQVRSLVPKLDLNIDMLEKFLSSDIKDHRPLSQDTKYNFSVPDLQESVKSWLRWLEEFSRHEIARLLELVVSVKGLYSVREESAGIGLPENWNTIWEDIGLPKLTYWSEFFQPLLTERVKGIIENGWMATLTNLKSNIIELLNKLVRERYEYPEHDLRWFIWKDSPHDIPQKLTHNGGLDNKRSLLMKTKAFSPNVVQLCESLDKGLCNLLEDLEQYLYESEHIVNIKDSVTPKSTRLISDTFSDRGEIQEHLQNVSTAMIDDLVHFVKNTCICDETKHGQSHVNAIVLARFLLALTTLCPNLNKCFTLSKLAGLTISNTKWQLLVENLKEESTYVWSVWAHSYKTNIRNHRHVYMTKGSDNNMRVHSIVSEWESVSIEEQSDDGKKIKTEIKIPHQPSIALQKFLTAIVKDLNKVIPHTIPRKILQEVIESIASELLDYYEKRSNTANLVQKEALQIVFDIKYCTLLMVPREHKVLVEVSTRATDSVLSKIDPFDYDVFKPFVQTNVKRSVLRSLLLFGNLVPHLEQLHSVLGARGEYGAAEGYKSDSPRLLAVCSGAPWFPPLAVTVPMRNLPLVTATIPEKMQRKKTVPTTKESGRNESAGSTIKSGAAAFFGAMGSDWFGSS